LKRFTKSLTSPENVGKLSGDQHNAIRNWCAQGLCPGFNGDRAMFFALAACTVIYFLTAAVFLPETKGKTLEEIEAYLEGAKAWSNLA
jgi:hypothetical protein